MTFDNRYRVLKEIGAGATSSVYKTRDLKNNTIIALKILSKTKTSSDVVQDFRREFSLLADLRHPNLCSVYDFGILKDGRSYFTMDYISGKDIFTATRGLTYKNLYPLIVQLCRALEYIHSKGLIHYDIKPSNVLIAKGETQRGESNKKHSAQSPLLYAKLLDFGLVGEQKTKDGMLIKGTFPYIAPEVIKGLTVDPRADLYSLGVLLYRICTRKSFKTGTETSFATFFQQQRACVAEPPSKLVTHIPKQLEHLITRLLSAEPAARFSRANEVIKEINKLSRKKFDIETEKTIEGYLLSSRFVGRDKEMSLLKSLYEQAQQGDGKVVLITGEAGIGKSRLLKEFKVFIQLKHGHCLAGNAYRDKIVPLEPFYDIFNELINHIHKEPDLLHSREMKLSLAVLFKIFPDLTVKNLRKNLPKLMSLEPEQDRVRNLNALSELIRFGASSLGELTILLEDMHWADSLSTQFLEYLSHNLEDRNILICVTYRRNELDKNLVLKQMITNLKHEKYFIHVELEPLNFRSLYSFLNSTITAKANSSRFTKYFMDKTGGNPFFVEEILRTLLRKRKVNIGEKLEISHLKDIVIPETIEEIVLKQIEDLDRISLQILKFAVILIKEFKYSLMKRLTNRNDTELTRALWQLKGRQVLIEEDNVYRFYHSTLREAVNKNLGHIEKIRMNYQTGKIFEKINRKNLDKVVEDLAHYFISARNRKKGIKYGLRAAKKSKERYANEQAIRFYNGVLSLWGNQNPKRRFDILRELADIEYHVGNHHDAIRHYNNALSLRVTTIDKKIKVYLRFGLLYMQRSEYNKALCFYQKAARYSKKMKPGISKILLEANINLRICRLYQLLEDYKHADKFNLYEVEFSPQYLKSDYLKRLQAGIYFHLADILTKKGEYSEIDNDKVILYYNKAYKYYKKIKTDVNIIIVSLLTNLGVNYYRKFDLLKALNCYQKSIKLSEKIGYHSVMPNPLYMCGAVLIIRGCYKEALVYLQKVLSISKKIRNPGRMGDSLLVLGTCYLNLCKYNKAREHFDKSLEIFNTIGWGERKFYSIMGIGTVHQAMGDYDSALIFYRKAFKFFRGFKHRRGVVNVFVNISSLFIELGQFSKAKRYLEDTLNIATVIGTKDNEVVCYLQLCQIYMMMKDYVNAVYYYKKGITIAKKIGMKHEILRLLLLASEIYYLKKEYLKGIKFANGSIKIAREIGTRDLYAEALLIKIKNEIMHGVLSRIEIFTILDKAKRIAEEIGQPEVLWKVYFEYGKFCKGKKQYFKALDYYEKCNEIFADVGRSIKNKSYKRSYLNRSDRQCVATEIDDIARLLD